MSLLVARDLRKDFGGVQAVAGVSFTVEAGELVALIGPNGAGKSTCFNLLNGQTRPDSGQVSLDGVDITGWPPNRVWRLGVGRSFQVAATFASMTARENVQMALIARHGRVWRFFRPARALFRDQAEALLALVGLAPADRLVLMDLVRRVAREQGRAVLFTEHDMDVVFTVADRVLVMDRGALIAQGSPDQVRADPRVRAVYLGDA